ncbi:glutamate synthase-related protein [Flavobacterium sp. ALD4]|jgi:glutamate synthase domain-containing protein 2|uniref:glutamate synthase-related protein n=1 Tax=Flavobacterium sp. ALD4 TaxID=2058314 RepID=UPI001E507212|nr:glutamate synthase-related protein [Flavobacterium sp. ALD4]
MKKNIGFKLCIVQTNEFELIYQEMILQNCFPDFITIDGAEGVTGAASLEFSDSVGMPFDPALIFVNKTLIKLDIRDKNTSNLQRKNNLRLLHTYSSSNRSRYLQ